MNIVAPAISRTSPIPSGIAQFVLSVLGSSPPVTVVSSGVADSSGTASVSVGVAEGVTSGVGVGVALGVGVAVAIGFGEPVALGVGVAVAVGVGLTVGLTVGFKVAAGVAVRQESLMIVLVSRVTEPFLASS